MDFDYQNYIILLHYNERNRDYEDMYSPSFVYLTNRINNLEYVKNNLEAVNDIVLEM